MRMRPFLTCCGPNRTFPYGKMVAAILDAIPINNSSTLLFPSRASEDRPLSGWSKYKRQLADGVAGWTLHDLRRTCTLTCRKCGSQLKITKPIFRRCYK
jgi:hypothetical protein